MKYALLMHPGHNRVYFEQAKKLAVPELELALRRFSSPCSAAEPETIAGIPYVSFVSEAALGDGEIGLLGRLSFVYAVFTAEDGKKGTVLTPVSVPDFRYMDPGISAILKYTGKTNELFTRLLINVAALSSDFRAEEELQLLDPVAGKGTTLFEGLVCGYHAAGIEIGSGAAEEACRYFKKYLETEKYKHTLKRDKIRGENRSFTAERTLFEFAQNREDQNNNRVRTFEMIAGNSAYADRYYRKNRFHIIVGDLPYGVQHGNVTAQKQSSLTRNPRELLQACLGGWTGVLARGGVLVLSWNSHVLPASEMAEILESAGLTVLRDPLYRKFEHRVDNSIRRDLIAAKKP